VLPSTCGATITIVDGLPLVVQPLQLLMVASCGATIAIIDGCLNKEKGNYFSHQKQPIAHLIPC